MHSLRNDNNNNIKNDNGIQFDNYFNNDYYCIVICYGKNVYRNLYQG